MINQRLRVRFLSMMLALGGSYACGDDAGDGHGDHGDHDHDEAGSGGTGMHDEGGTGGTHVEDVFEQALFVAHQGSLVSYDIDTGEELPGAVQDIDGPVDIQALDDGTLLVNLTNSNEILVVDGTTMLETARISSTDGDGTRPVHSYVSPVRGGAQYFMSLNDGTEGAPDTNSAALVDIADGSDKRFERVGEVALGVGHHKASFSSTKERVVISNISDCDNVLSVYDYSDIDNIEELATLTGEAAGWTAADPGDGNFDPRFCDVTYARGVPPAPHGCATSSVSGKAYCSMTGSGEMVVIDIDADPPTFDILATGGSGGGFTLAHPGGRYMYTMQEGPREGDGGEDCQVGQIVVTDAMDDSVVAKVPVRYTGPDCSDALAGTPAETANPGGHAYFSHDGDTLFVPSNGGFMVEDARVDQVIVLDASDPANPEQLASISVGEHTGHSAGALSGDGKWLFVVHSVDGTVSQIDTAKRSVVKTIEVGDNPKCVTTYGSAEGPAEQTGPIH